jgi:iron complex transport system substrate-binding protein
LQRIVSLVPSATEIVAALGLADRLVGRSHECDWPPRVRDLPVCTAPAFDPHGSSAEIDRRVKDRLREALSIYRIDDDLLRDLRPDAILTQAQCEVCAVSLADVERSVRDRLAIAPRVVSLEPRRLGDVWDDVERVGAVLGEAERGVALASSLRGRVDGIAADAAGLPERPTVVCVEWLDPPMAAGNWMPELVELAGGVNLFGSAGQHSPWLTWEEIVAADPAVIVLLPCGFDIPRTLVELPAITDRTDWRSLRAVREGRVVVADGNAYFNRPGPRLVESLEILAEVFHPEAFRFGHDGTGWRPVEAAA